MLRAMECGDMADFEGLLNGETTLQELRDSGVNTEVVKRIRQRKRTVSTDDRSEETIEHEIELHDRAGADFDRVVEHTDGRPRQTLEHGDQMSLNTVEFIIPGISPPSESQKTDYNADCPKAG